MSLGTGDLQVGGGLSTTDTARRYPWQPCERELPLHAATTWHRCTDKRSVEKILTIPYTYLNPRIVRVGGLGARIRNDSQKFQRKWSAKISWKWSETMPQGVLQAARGHPAGHIPKWGVTADCIGSRLTLPKFHLATFKSLKYRNDKS